MKLWLQLAGARRSRDPSCLSETFSSVPEIVIYSFDVRQSEYAAVLGINLPRQSIGVPASVMCDWLQALVARHAREQQSSEQQKSLPGQIYAHPLSLMSRLSSKRCKKVRLVRNRLPQAHMDMCCLLLFCKELVYRPDGLISSILPRFRGASVAPD